MSLSKEERVELVLVSGREGWSYRQIANDFDARHPRRSPISFGTVGKVVRKLNKTGSVLDKPCSGRPTIMDDKVREVVIAKVTVRPKNSIHMTSFELGIPRETVRRILKAEKFHLYRLQILRNLTEDAKDVLVLSSITVGCQERGLSKTLPVFF
jgi:transposase